MTDDMEKQFRKSSEMARRQFRKDVNGFKQRRRLELEDLLRTEREKPEDLQDPQKIEWILNELRDAE